ncbi:hypothetical protein EX30DRAFT_344867 [Ascodesmis nigricans]|uniref:Uncharacterized protein n=1 Tax=Ascodesmis nigricans TaxID=341454 RepID=A0A4S2MHV1_9PEZI|nr:hypothetical protein EX30DRAFT_344867 [Ascodesmis nigricans]
MSNLQPPNFEPEISDLRTRATPTSGFTSTSALSRRNANRLNRRQTRRESPQAFERYQTRRVDSYRRSPLSPPPLISRSASLEEPAPKRRRMGRTGPQMEIEQLPMTLKHCDGGAYQRHHPEAILRVRRGMSNRDPDRYVPEYAPESALRDDNTVYCSMNRKCNMILQHAEGACFSVQRLVVRAPSSGYTCPVSAGMIFVAMDDRDLLSRTNYTFPLDEHLGYAGEETDNSVESCEEDNDDGHGSGPSNFLSRASLFSPVISTSFPFAPSTMTNIRQHIHSPAPPHTLWANLEEHRSAPVDLLKPDAVFASRDEKSTKFVIDFNPPLSGKYILAKFFCSRRDDVNIDIGAYGWTGRRCFPSIDMK